MESRVMSRMKHEMGTRFVEQKRTVGPSDEMGIR